MLADKDVPAVSALLVPVAQRLYLASPCSERALGVNPLAAIVAPHGVPAQAFSSIADALAAARAVASAEGEGSLVLVAGSLYAVGEAQAGLAKCSD